MKSTISLSSAALVTLSYVLTPVHAIAFGGARPTAASILKPALTAGLSTVTSAPELPVGLLRARDVGDNTCGYEDGLPASEYTCNDPSRTCVYYKTAGVGARGCCLGNDRVNCGWHIDCIGLYDTASPRPTDSFTLQCTNSARPYCKFFTFQGLGVLDFGCGSTLDRTYHTILTTSLGQVLSSSQNNYIVTNNNAISSKTIQTSFPTAGGSGSTSTPSSDGDEKKKAPIGAIVGGVVGGLAFLAIVAAVIIFIILGQKKKQRNAAAAASASSNQPTTPAAPGYVSTPNEKDYAQTQTNSYYGSEAGGVAQPVQYAQDGTLQPQAYDQRAMSPAPTYAPSAYMSPQPTGQTYVSPQPTGTDGQFIPEAGGAEVDKSAIPTHRNGAEVFEAPASK